MEAFEIYARKANFKKERIKINKQAYSLADWN